MCSSSGAKLHEESRSPAAAGDQSNWRSWAQLVVRPERPDPPSSSNAWAKPFAEQGFPNRPSGHHAAQQVSNRTERRPAAASRRRPGSRFRGAFSLPRLRLAWQCCPARGGRGFFYREGLGIESGSERQAAELPILPAMGFRFADHRPSTSGSSATDLRPTSPPPTRFRVSVAHMDRSYRQSPYISGGTQDSPIEACRLPAGGDLGLGTFCAALPECSRSSSALFLGLGGRSATARRPNRHQPSTALFHHVAAAE